MPNSRRRFKGRPCPAYVPHPKTHNAIPSALSVQVKTLIYYRLILNKGYTRKMSLFISILLLWALPGFAMPPSVPGFLFYQGFVGHQVVYFNHHNRSLSVSTEYTCVAPLAHPAAARRAGGIQFVCWIDQDGAGDATNIPLQVSTSLSDTHAESLGQVSWIFRLATGPHMSPFPRNAEAPRVFSSYGIFWSQVQAYAASDGRSDVTSLEWISNPDYDRRWEQFGASRYSQPIFFPESDWGEQYSRLVSIGGDLFLPRRFMNELTNSRNPTFGDEQRLILRQLLDWDPELEPTRDFPLLRRTYSKRLQKRVTFLAKLTRSVSSLTTMALQQIDWSGIGLSLSLRMALEGGLPSPSQCAEALRATAGHLQSSRVSACRTLCIKNKDTLKPSSGGITLGKT